MSNWYTTNTFQKDETVTYLGMQAKVLGTTDSGSVKIELEDGSIKIVNKATLMAKPVFDWNKELRESNLKRMEKYKAQAAEAGAEKDILKKQLRLKIDEIQNKFSEWGTKMLHAMTDEQKAEYKALKGDKQDLNCAITALGNREFSASLSAFCAAIDSAKYA